jgi:hypothetical protein
MLEIRDISIGTHVSPGTIGNYCLPKFKHTTFHFPNILWRATHSNFIKIYYKIHLPFEEWIESGLCCAI